MGSKDLATGGHSGLMYTHLQERGSHLPCGVVNNKSRKKGLANCPTCSICTQSISCSLLCLSYYGEKGKLEGCGLVLEDLPSLLKAQDSTLSTSEETRRAHIPRGLWAPHFQGKLLRSANPTTP